MVMNTTPLALPGRWRISTSPAIDRRLPSLIDAQPVGGDELCARIMLAQEAHRVRLQAEADGLIIVHDMLGERHGGELRRLAFRAFVARLGISEQRQVGR